jgi:hypothetical protein
MTDYTDREHSVQDGQPVELYEFTGSAGSDYLTSAELDYTLGGITYAATPGLDHGPISLVQIDKVRELIVIMPLDHPLTARLLNNGIPPRDATLTLIGAHRGAATTRELWQGPIAGLETDPHNATVAIRVPNALDAAFDVLLPHFTLQRDCQWRLYGPGCRLDRDYPTFATQGHLVATTVSAIDGNTITVDMQGKADGFASFGEVRRLIDGERRDVLRQTGDELRLDVAFGTLEDGDELEVWEGCNKSIGRCEELGNVVRFGGHPYAPAINPLAPTRLGIKRGV